MEHIRVFFRRLGRILSRAVLALFEVWRLHEAVRFAFPEHNAIFAFIALTLVVSGINAVEPL